MTESKEKACFSPKIFTTHPKNGKRQPNKKAILEDSIALSMLSTIDSDFNKLGMYEGEIVHLSFDIPKKLRDTLNQTAKANGSSTCQILRLLSYAYVKSEYVKKHASGNTINSPEHSAIVIENLVSNQYCQTRPRRFQKKELLEETVTYKEPSSKIVFPEPKVLVSMPRVSVSPCWSGVKVDLVNVLDNWACTSIEGRLNAVKFAQAFPSTPEANQVLKWYESYLASQKQEGS